MAWKPAPMKVICPKCKRTEIFALKSDVLMGLPWCKKCGATMQFIGEVTLLDWINNLKSCFK
ncbi:MULTISPECIES: hypothetical protein [Acinetobacter]|jgi:transcription elongation factor Elf1|uniref:hypothetical protein n=1 Tax=Acinetobacter TaxID=469 RepID=UPI000556A05C|nr:MULTISPECIES: hypothetical protein [Acinetobacter]MDI1223027.1 hypothetical protein [Acinetobacter sp.]